MATILEYAYLANDVYYNNAHGIYDKHGYYRINLGKSYNLITLPNWVGLPKKNEKIRFPSLYDPGFFARLYANLVTRETIIAFRGTNLLHLNDLKADINLAERNLIPRDLDANSFYLWAKHYLHQQTKSHFSLFPKLTGHSLGGYLAQYVAIRHPGTIAVIFNAPGIGGFTDPIKGYINPNRHIYKKTIYNFDINYEPIHKIGHLIGNVQLLPGDSNYNSIEQRAHNLLTPQLAEQLKNNPVSIIHDPNSYLYFIHHGSLFAAGYFGLEQHVIQALITNLQLDPHIGNQSV